MSPSPIRRHAAVTGLLPVRFNFGYWTRCLVSCGLPIGVIPIDDPQDQLEKDEQKHIAKGLEYLNSLNFPEAACRRLPRAAAGVSITECVSSLKEESVPLFEHVVPRTYASGGQVSADYG